MSKAIAESRMTVEAGAGAQASGGFVHYENFGFLRLIAAGSVMFSHSFLIASGNEYGEPLVMLLGPHNIVGIYAVFVFLILSGFLVSRSAELSSSTISFLWKRSLRIYPGLAVCALVLGLGIAPFFSSLGPEEFLRSGLGLDFTPRRSHGRGTLGR